MINSRIACSKVVTPSDIEPVTVQINTHSHEIIFYVLYLPPHCSNDYYNSFINTLCNLNNPVIIVGDFNFPDINWGTLTGSSTPSKELCNLIFNLNLIQFVEQPTHILGNMLDLIFRILRT